MSLITPAVADEPLALTTTQLPRFEVRITDAALEQRKAAIETAQEIVSVATASEREDALVACGFLKGLLKMLKETKETVKRPILDAGQAVDKAVKDYAGAIDVELARVEKLVNAFTYAEQQRIQALREEEMRDMRAKASQGISEDEMREQAARTAELMQKPMVAGARVDTFTDYEVMDIMELAKARPDLVEITPRRREILGYLSIPNHAKLPGLCEFPATRVHSKALA